MPDFQIPDAVHTDRNRKARRPGYWQAYCTDESAHNALMYGGSVLQNGWPGYIQTAPAPALRRQPASADILFTPVPDRGARIFEVIIAR